MKRLIIITTHPVQYNAPLFQLLAARGKINIKVLYTWGQAKEEVYDPGFKKNRSWDIPLLEGYDLEFAENTGRQPGSHHFKGIDNPRIIKTIEDHDPDAILVYGWNFKSHLKILRFYKGRRKVFFRGDSTLLDEPKHITIKKYLRYIFLNWVYKHVDKAFYAGKANREYFIKYGLKSSQLIFAPHAVDNNRFACEHTDMRKELNIPQSAIVFLFAGKFQEKKDPFILLDAFEQLEDPNVYLIFAGDGELEGKLKERSAASAVAGRINFTGFQNQSAMPALYKTCDVFVLPSSGPGESWGLAVNEAMASGRAVLVSNKCGCYKDLIQEEVNGFVFEAGDLADLVLKMKALICGKEKLPGMGKASLEIIKSWSYENICSAIEAEMNNN